MPPEIITPTVLPSRPSTPSIQHDLDAWRSAHRELAAALGAIERGRDHCDAMHVIAAIKSTFCITHVAVTPDGAEVQITTADGCIHRARVAEERT